MIRFLAIRILRALVTVALAVLAFFGNSLPLLVMLMGLYGWERYARIARGLAISAGAQGYAGAIRQLGARRRGSISATSCPTSPRR